MGYYVEVPNVKHKAFQLIDLHDATMAEPLPTAYEDIPEGKALIVVIDNGPFEAALFVYNKTEFNYIFNRPDPRPREYLYIDRRKAEILSGYNP